MSCTPPVRTITVARNQPVWSQGGATNQGLSDVFVFTGDDVMQIAPMLSQVRATLIVDNRTINAEVEVVMQSTLDGVNWSNPMAALASINQWATNRSTRSGGWGPPGPIPLNCRPSRDCETTCANTCKGIGVPDVACEMPGGACYCHCRTEPDRRT